MFENALLNGLSIVGICAVVAVVGVRWLWNQWG
jgi:hypothetical protein